MKANIIQIGDSKGVRIPQILLKQLQFEEFVELEILPEGLLLRPLHTQTKANPRAGWSEMFSAAVTENGDDSAEFAEWNQIAPNQFDEKEW